VKPLTTQGRIARLGTRSKKKRQRENETVKKGGRAITMIDGAIVSWGGELGDVPEASGNLTRYRVE